MASANITTSCFCLRGFRRRASATGVGSFSRLASATGGSTSLGRSSFSCICSPLGFFCKPPFLPARLGRTKGLKPVGLLDLGLCVGPKFLALNDRG